LLAGFQVRGEALKGCSAGGWRSGRRRSEKGWRRGHFRPLLWVIHACRFPLEQLACHEKKFSGNYELLGVRIDCFSRRALHTDPHTGPQNKLTAYKGRTQSFLTGFNFGGNTEGLLGGRLAQRQAALREVMAAGAFPTFTLGLHACRSLLEQLACQKHAIPGISE